jgi:hypothetical protein
MKSPSERGALIDTARRRRWLDAFRAYKAGVLEETVVEWVDQFDMLDRDLAARVLDVVDFYSIPRIETAFRDVLASLPGWHADESLRKGKWRFCEFSASPGTSAGDMLYRFKYANKMTGHQFKDLFIGRSQILASHLGKDDSLVLVDDFVGTGEQAKEAFDLFFQELIASVGKTYLVTVAARSEAIDTVFEQTGIEVRSAQILMPSDSPINEMCTYFTNDEKVRLVAYGARADKKRPRGFGDCGLVVVFYHNCPNNSLPILHASNKKWTPLFPRHT